jgi:DNA-binding transcriptional LysR family regulator
VHDDLAAGRLVPVLEDFNPRELQPIHAVYLGKAGRVPARVRAVLDYLVAQLSISERFAPHRVVAPRRARKSSAA